MFTLSEKIQNLHHSPTLHANDLVRKRRAMGQTIYHMGFGESPFPVPQRLQKALAEQAFRKEYLPAGGLEELAQTVKEYYRPVLGDEVVDGCDILVAPGSKLILWGLQFAIEGDLIMPDPSWVSYAPQAQMLGTQIIRVPTILNDEGYHIDPDVLRDTIQSAREKGLNPSKIILNYPNNPTGLTIPDDMLSRLAEVCREEGIFVISDEIYGFVSYDGKYRSIASQAPEITAITTGLSKHLSLGGWRLGVGFIPKAVDGLFDGLCRMVSETWSCVSSPIQAAAIEAYKGYDDIEQHIQDCTDIHALANRYISQGLKDAGIVCSMAQGAFYNYPDFEPFREKLAQAGIKTSGDLHEYLLDKYNLATLPGTGFGADPEQLALRLSGCDYDGARALDAYRAGASLDTAFIQTYMPHIIRQVEIFTEFVEAINNESLDKRAA